MDCRESQTIYHFEQQINVLNKKKGCIVMTKEVFDKIVKKANKHPIVLYGDNMMLCHINFDGSYFVQDDNCVYCFRVNKTAGGNYGISQQESPYEVLVFDYDMIQYAKIFPDTATLKSLFDGTDPVIEGQTVEEIKHEICSSRLMQACSPRGVIGDDYTVASFGDTPGASMVLGKELDNYTRAAQKANNERIIKP